MTRTYQPVAVCGESRKHGSEREDWEAIPSSTPTPQPADTIVTLGDYVDRGPDSKGVLDRLISLHETGRLVALRGNHELVMLNAVFSSQNESYWRICGGADRAAWRQP